MKKVCFVIGVSNKLSFNQNIKSLKSMIFILKDKLIGVGKIFCSNKIPMG